MTKNKDKRYPVAIDDLLIEFDEMSYAPTNLCEDPEKEAIAWKDRLRHELDLLLDEKSAIERRAVEAFVGKFKEKAQKGAHNDLITYKFIERDYTITESKLNALLKEYEDEQEKQN